MADLRQYLASETATLTDHEKDILGIDQNPSPVVEAEKTDYTKEELFAMLDPTTGERYFIPWLDMTDAYYKEKYADAMQTRISDPIAFAAMLRGD